MMPSALARPCSERLAAGSASARAACSGVSSEADHAPPYLGPRVLVRCHRARVPPSPRRRRVAPAPRQDLSPRRGPAPRPPLPTHPVLPAPHQGGVAGLPRHLGGRDEAPGPAPGGGPAHRRRRHPRPGGGGGDRPLGDPPHEPLREGAPAQPAARPLDHLLDEAQGDRPGRQAGDGEERVRRRGSPSASSARGSTAASRRSAQASASGRARSSTSSTPCPGRSSPPRRRRG